MNTSCAHAVALCCPRPRSRPPPRAQPDLGVPSKDGLVVCVSAPACDAGATVLAKGGNAVDAAVATAFALAVTHPSAGNIGGGGFMIVRTPSGDVTAFDYREKAPLKSDQDDVPRSRRADRSQPDRRRLSRARRARHGARARARAQEVREAAVEGRRCPVRRARRRLHDVGGPRAQPQPRGPGPDGSVSGVGRRLRQARRRGVGGRRSAGPGRPGEDARERSPTAAPTRSTKDGSPTASPRT